MEIFSELIEFLTNPRVIGSLTITATGTAITIILGIITSKAEKDTIAENVLGAITTITGITFAILLITFMAQGIPLK